MATVKPRLKTQFKITGACLSHTRTDVEVRDVETTIDEPEERGGTNMGLTPVETLMASLLGCTNVITHKIAAAKGIPIDAMTVDAVVDFDRRGAALMEEIEVPFPKVVLTIAITTTADDDAIETLKTELPRFCPVSKVIRHAGTEIEEVWKITRP